MPAKQAVTISDVARQAGLSVATVSRALNRSPKLDPQTAKRVFEAVEQLGYNAAPITGRATERSRMREKCYTVEVILSPQPEQKDMLQLNFFSNVYTGIQSFFLQAGNITTGLVTWDCSWGQISDLPPRIDGTAETGRCHHACRRPRRRTHPRAARVHPQPHRDLQQ